VRRTHHNVPNNNPRLPHPPSWRHPSSCRGWGSWAPGEARGSRLAREQERL